MAGLLTGKIAKTIFKGFKGKLLKGTLRIDTPSSSLDDNGDPVSATAARFGIEGFTDEFSAFYRAQAGIPETDLKVNIFSESVPGITPTKDSRVTFGGVWYRIRKVKVDPAGALFECQSFEIPTPADEV